METPRSHFFVSLPSCSIWRRDWIRVGLVFLAILWGVAGCGEPPSVEDTADGKELFARSGCGLCHGEGGRGDGPLVRADRVARVDLADEAAFRYGREIEEIVSVIAEGRTSGRGFMPPHAHLSEGEQRELAIYILALSSEADGASRQEESIP